MVAVDKGLLQWLIGAAGAFILFLIGLAIKDVKVQLDKIPKLCLELERVRAKYDKDVAELLGEIRLLEQRIDDVASKGN